MNIKRYLLSSVARAPEMETGAGEGVAFTMEPEEIATIRGYYSAKFNRETTLNDEQIVSAVESNNDVIEADNADGWADKLSEIEAGLAGDDDEEQTPEAKAKSVSVQSGVSAKATEFANEAAKNADFNKAVAEAVEQEEKGRVRPLEMARMLSAIHGDKLGEMPLVGSDITNCGNRIPDKYSYPVTSANGEKTNVTGSFWRDYACSLPLGKEEMNEIAKIKARQSDKAGQKQTNRLTLLRHEARLESVVKCVRIAVRVLQQLDRINTECGPVEALHHFVIAKDEKTGKKLEPEQRIYSVAKEPIYVGSTEKGPEAKDDWDFYSVSQLLSMKPDVAKANGGGFAALVATMKRPPKAPDGELPPVKLENFVAYVTNLERFLSTDGNDTALTKVLSSGRADALLLTLDDVHNRLDNLLGPFTAGKGGKPGKVFQLRQAMKEAEAKLTAGKQEQQRKAS